MFTPPAGALDGFFKMVQDHRSSRRLDPRLPSSLEAQWLSPTLVEITGDNDGSFKGFRDHWSCGGVHKYLLSSLDIQGLCSKLE